jgi:hypothetical protein
VRFGAALAVGLVALLVACDGPTASDDEGLHGTWAEVQPLQPRGSMVRFLRFEASGVFTARVNSYGVYDGSDELSSYSETTGTYEVSSDRLLVHTEWTETWDSFHGDQEPIRAVASGSPFDDCTFEVDGNRLVLHYMSYPADAPVPTVMTLVRVP